MLYRIDPEAMQAARDRGEADHKTGKRQSDNPYDLDKETTLYLCWDDGWVTSKEIANECGGMTKQLTPEQARIAELFGTIDVLEALLVGVLAKSAREGSLDDTALKQQIAAFIEDSHEPQENEWGERAASAQRATAIRIGGMIGIGQIVTRAVKRSTQGEA
ncbi:hypothetical protein [Paracoccus sp. TOH]|uniref:hypothetical protein n=1 Tax=Paracoccus sp. TOH TaxID=1263728 RepID=UPI0025B119EC|nr:hypothetical protein [Paracoccus sp. TOH]WJS87202.1 hypothetical protein NBE95_20195 [Paracoccus sp. TOH]